MPGLLPAQIYAISGALEAASVIIQLLATLKAWIYWIFLSLLKVVLFAGFMYVFGKTLDPLIGVSVGQLIAQFLFLGATLYVCYRITVLKPVYDNHQ